MSTSAMIPRKTTMKNWGISTRLKSLARRCSTEAEMEDMSSKTALSYVGITQNQSYITAAVINCGLSANTENENLHSTIHKTAEYGQKDIVPLLLAFYVEWQRKDGLKPSKLASPQMLCTLNLHRPRMAAEAESLSVPKICKMVEYQEETRFGGGGIARLYS
ncbi:hypothetical protein INT44_000669 [Umbelopsis vinacea]|uniref:Uncharacterized protein n=1 Tax=Umbelopsis vinacea TaxID=44442 RepID=A0A8H7Q7J5_9FUNG|nr:hypothetical protein INT44_000669 [Umbelopsis vinacea]